MNNFLSNMCNILCFNIYYYLYVNCIAVTYIDLNTRRTLKKTARVVMIYGIFCSFHCTEVFLACVLLFYLFVVI